MSDNGGFFRYGNFEVLTRSAGVPDLLGGGSFGKTYKAKHVFLDQVVALKVISEKYAHDKNAKERFLREARVVHGLRHPHIAQVIDFGEANNTLYYAMEYCEGGSLEELVKRTGPLDATTVLLLAQQLAEALECSHNRGFIHRDVKPANVMLADKSDALVLKLVDFGLVKPLPGESERMASLTLDGQNFFTPLFASPEQVMEEELDARSDLFSLGMTLWFLLKGGAPESGSTAVIMSKRLSADSYQARLPAVLPAKLRFIIEKLLEKDKSHRFSSASEVLRAIASDDPVAELTPPPIPQDEPVEESSDAMETLMLETPTQPHLADKYTMHEKVGRSSLGNIYRATRIDTAVPLSVTVFDDVLRADTERMARLQHTVSQLGQQTHEAICQVFGIEEFIDAQVLVREWNGGVSLQNIVKSRGSIPFAEAAPLLRTIAAGVDFVMASALPGVRLAPDEIFLQPADGSLDFPEVGTLLTTHLRNWPPFRIRLTPILLEDEAAQDISMTMSAQAIGSPRVEFGSLLYRLVAGMQVKFAARVNRASYIRTSGLSEEGNWILSGCIVDEPTGGEGCLGMLEALQRIEGVSDSEPPPTATARKPGATTRSRGLAASPAEMRPAVAPSGTQNPSQKRDQPPPASPIATQSTRQRETPAPAVNPIATQSTRLKTSPARPADPIATQGVRSGPPPVPPSPNPILTASIPTTLPPVRGPEQAQPEPHEARQYEPIRQDVPPSKPLPLIPIVVGLFVACGVLGALAYMVRPKPRVDNPTPAPSVAPQTPEPSPVASATVAPTARPPEPPQEFVLRGGSQLGASTFELGCKTVTPQRRGQDLVFASNRTGGSTDDLVVRKAGYKPVHVTVSAGGTFNASSLERETGNAFFALQSRDIDYAIIVFAFAEPLPGENVTDTPLEKANSLKNVDSRSRVELLTGKYTYWLCGPSGKQDTHILPRKGTLSIQAQGRTDVPVPPTFAGRFQCEFDDGPVHVSRIVTIKPGLVEGHVDDEYSTNGARQESVKNVPLAELRLDADGVLHGHVRYAGHANAQVHNYDELFEIRHTPDGGSVMAGGREMMPNDPTMRADLEKRLSGKSPRLNDRPGEAVLRRSD